MPAALLRKTEYRGIRAVQIPLAGRHEYFITAAWNGTGAPSDIHRTIAEYLRGENARLVSVTRFTQQSCLKEAAEGIEALGAPQWPDTLVLGDETDRRLGILAWAVSGVDTAPVRAGNKILGTVFEDEDARYCRLGGVLPESAGASDSDQAAQVFDQIEEALIAAGMDFGNVIRTWFFNRGILDWYGGFNRVRSDFFAKRGVFGQRVPASTGVGGWNAAGAALINETFAVQPKSNAVRAEAVPSPLQCPALQYGSSFNRAAMLTEPGCRRLFISGTASIDAEGNTIHVGDIGGQIDWTMRVVRGILASKGMDWENVVQSTAYFRHLAEAPAFDRWLETHHLGGMPVIVTQNTVCRGDLLFELEATAIAGA